MSSRSLSHSPRARRPTAKADGLRPADRRWRGRP